MARNYVKGIISYKSEIQQGTSQNGYDWARQVVVIEVASFNNTFSKIALTAQNQRVDDLMKYQIGDRVEVAYTVTAREYQGKWFNNVDLAAIKSIDEGEENDIPQDAPAMPQGRIHRPAMTTPSVPAGTNLDPQEGDLPI